MLAEGRFIEVRSQWDSGTKRVALWTRPGLVLLTYAAERNAHERIPRRPPQFRLSTGHAEGRRSASSVRKVLRLIARSTRTKRTYLPVDSDRSIPLSLRL